MTGLEALIEDPRFAKNPDRNHNYDVLRPLIAEKMMLKTTEEWQKILDDNGVPNGPINSIDKVLEDEQVLAREMIIEVDHPTAGKLKMPGVAIKLSETPGAIHSPAPLLGQHTTEILKAYMGYTDAEIDKLYEDGVL